jgi:hypothetical protein
VRRLVVHAPTAALRRWDLRLDRLPRWVLRDTRIEIQREIIARDMAALAEVIEARFVAMHNADDGPWSREPGRAAS